jgi:transcriptional regulator with PAS, ATPase and Fis domain
VVESALKEHVKGLVIRAKDGRVLTLLGLGSDRRVLAVVTNDSWFAEAVEKRLVQLLLNDASLSVLIREVGDGHLILLTEVPTDTVLSFLLNVDFAYDILHHILTDPYDAMVVVDEEAKVSFIAPIHKKFFALRHGEAKGKHVRDVIENTKLHNVVKTGIAEVGQVQKMRDSERIVSRHPIHHNGRIVGAIGRIMCKGPQQVEALARRVKALEHEIAAYKQATTETSKGEQYLDAIIGQSIAIQAVRHANT